VASLAIRPLLDGQRRRARVLAALPTGIYLEFRAPVSEPRVVALATSAAVCLPNAVVVKLPAPRAADSGPGPLAAGTAADDTWAQDAWATDAWVGDGCIEAGNLEVWIRRWWDPSPVLGPLSRVRLDQGAAVLQRACATAGKRPGLDGHDAPVRLADCCGAGDLAGAVAAAEHLVGLGPGLTPSGDNVIIGLLLALRLLGGAISGGTRPVWLADWLGAAVTCYAAERTTPLAATLLHCAARGQAAAEVSAVLRGFAGQEPVEPAARRLLASGHAGADLTYGLVAGCRAALALSAQ